MCPRVEVAFTTSHSLSPSFFASAGGEASRVRSAGWRQVPLPSLPRPILLRRTALHGVLLSRSTGRELERQSRGCLAPSPLPTLLSLPRRGRLRLSGSTPRVYLKFRSPPMMSIDGSRAARGVCSIIVHASRRVGDPLLALLARPPTFGFKNDRLFRFVSYEDRARS